MLAQCGKAGSCVECVQSLYADSWPSVGINAVCGPRTWSLSSGMCTMQEMMDAVHASGVYEGEGKLTGSPNASKGKLVCNAATRQARCPTHSPHTPTSSPTYSSQRCKEYRFSLGARCTMMAQENSSA